MFGLFDLVNCHCEGATKETTACTELGEVKQSVV